ncbi:MAG: acyl-CoA thioesterase [Alphaproteobacteria bacterium]|nr:MAG: acyl-CoA thioesterase [Alphaproteobacteria bacterium]
MSEPSDNPDFPNNPSLRTIAMPADTNPNGDMFGGWMMSMMDLAGANKAIEVSKGPVVTVAVDAMEFHLPAYVGDEVSCYSLVEKIGNTSITVRVEAWARRRTSHEYFKITVGRFTYVSIGADRRPKPIIKM